MEKNNPLVSIIILNHNGKLFLESCLESVFASIYSPFEVIVVDNGSTDGSVEAAQNRWNFTLVKKNSNTGYAAGNNAGIKLAKGEYLVLLNNDVIVDPSWLSKLVPSCIQCKTDFGQPKVLAMEQPRIINSVGLIIHLAGFGLLKGHGEIDEGQYDNTQQTFGFHGACVLASRNAIERVGLLDEMFFAYNEDTDWSWRVLLMGLKVVCVPEALIYHRYRKQGGLNLFWKTYYAERNRIIMLLTNYSRRSFLLLLPFFMLVESATLLYCFVQGILSAKILGYADLFRMRGYIAERHRRIQRTRIKSDREIIKVFTIRFRHPFFGRFADPLNKLCAFLYGLIVPFV